MITNRYNLPKAVVEAVKNDSYTPGESDITVTQLIGPPMIRYLKNKHHGEISVDASDRLWSLYGQAAHYIIERSGVDNELSEKRLYVDYDGVYVGGQIDNICMDKGILTDFKMTSVWAVKEGIKPEWEAQLNVLAELCRRNNIAVKKLQIVALIKDWRRTEFLRYSDYPEVPVKVIDIPMWTNVEKYILERIRIHKEPVCCTPEERWARPDKYAVIKPGRKSAVRVFNTQTEAEVYIEENNVKNGHVEHRKGENVRCESYCEVSKFCKCK